QGKGKLLQIYIDESDKWNDEPLYEAIVNQLRAMGISGATVYRAVMGYGATGQTRKQRVLHISRDLPVIVSVVESAEKLKEVMDKIEEMMEDGLIVTSDVDFVRLVPPPISSEEPS